jgi:pimeloyl-ACP methyl ester carboxylesterase
VAIDPGGTHFEITGRGHDVVLVHGLGLNLHMWRAQVEGLCDQYRVLRYDLIGHGKSGRPAAPYAMGDFVRQLEELVSFVGIGPFAIVGFSLGGLIAQAYTLAHHARVRALAVLHSAYHRSDAERDAIRARVRMAQAAGPKATIEAALERWFTADFAQSHPEIIDEVRQWVIANDPSAFAAAYHVLAEADAPLAARISAIDCPTLVMTGEEDHGNSPEMALRMSRSIRGAECRILPGLRHMAAMESPPAVLEPLRTFLERVYGEPRS